MIELGTTSFYLDAPIMSRDELAAYSTRLFEEWDARLADNLELPDYSLSLEVKEGSVEGLATVGVVAAKLAAGVIAYGGLVAGLEAIRKQVRAAGDYLAERAAAPFVRLNLKPRVRRRSGTLGKLQRLFLRVQRSELDPEEALREAEAFLGDDAVEAPEFVRLLGEALRGVRRNPEQLMLPMDLPEETLPDVPAPARPGTRVSKKPAMDPLQQQWRVELWRESRTGQRQIRITEM